MPTGHAVESPSPHVARSRSLAVATAACVTTSSRTQTAPSSTRILAIAAPVRGEPRPRRLPPPEGDPAVLRPAPGNDGARSWSPGGGWYTQVIAPLVRERGRYLAGLAPLGPSRTRTRCAATRHFRALLAAAPELLDQVEVVPFSPGRGADHGGEFRRHGADVPQLSTAGWPATWRPRRSPTSIAC